MPGFPTPEKVLVQRPWAMTVRNLPELVGDEPELETDGPELVLGMPTASTLLVHLGILVVTTVLRKILRTHLGCK